MIRRGPRAGEGDRIRGQATDRGDTDAGAQRGAGRMWRWRTADLDESAMANHLALVMETRLNLSSWRWTWRGNNRGGSSCA